MSDQQFSECMAFVTGGFFGGIVAIAIIRWWFG